LTQNFKKNVPDHLKIAVFASGKGSNFEAILKAIEEGRVKDAGIVCVVSNNSAAGALETARRNGIAALHISRTQFESDQDFDDHLIDTLTRHGANFVVLAGYMKKVNPAVIAQFRNRIVNIHPALLPDFGGKGMYGEHVHQAVIASGRKVSGATVHLVDDVYDHGAIVLQKTVDVAPGETAETLAKKVLAVEHELYPEAIRLFAEGKVTISGNTASIRL
jgi:formyltetrahydrofolate-dependent phosphoribosylglycinamide formyltransferase